MMDPTSGLSPVANIFEVVGFAGEVLRIARQIRKAGNPLILTALERSAAHANSTSELIKRSILSCQPAIGISPEDQDLIHLVEEAGRIGAEIRHLA
jgi:hypothetical protein